MLHIAPNPHVKAPEGDLALLPAIVEVARAAGARILAVFSLSARPRGRADMFIAGKRLAAV